MDVNSFLCFHLVFVRSLQSAARRLTSSKCFNSRGAFRRSPGTCLTIRHLLESSSRNDDVATSWLDARQVADLTASLRGVDPSNGASGVRLNCELVKEGFESPDILGVIDKTLRVVLVAICVDRYRCGYPLLRGPLTLQDNKDVSKDCLIDRSGLRDK